MLPLFKALVVVFIVLTFLLLQADNIRDAVPSVKNMHMRYTTHPNPVTNSTLGFQQIFALSLPERADRRIPLINAAKATNISFTSLDAVRDKEIPKDEWPKGWNSDNEHKEGELGCLISHKRTWEKIISQNITTALILESDADWDLRIKTTLIEVAKGTTQIADYPFTSSPSTPSASSSSPYGLNWDILWIGNCGLTLPPSHARIYHFYDPSVPPAKNIFHFRPLPTTHQLPPDTRLVSEFTDTVCTYSYAISHAGAIKMHRYFEEINDPIDNAMAHLCRDRGELVCVGVWPNVVASTASVGNIAHPGGSGKERENGTVMAGRGIQFSARVNAGAVGRGLGREEWVAEW